MDNLSDYKKILLPIQESVAEEIEEALSLVEEAKSESERIGKYIYLDEDKRYSKSIHRFRSDCIELEEKYGSSIELAKVEADMWMNSPYLLYSEDSAARHAECGLEWITTCLGSMFPKGADTSRARWSSGDLDLAVQYVAAARGITMSYCWALPPEEGDLLRNASIKFKQIQWKLVNCRYEDQIEEFRLALDERQLMLNESMHDISRSAETQSTRMTILTLFVSIATLVSVLIAAKGCISSHDERVEESLAGIEQRLQRIEGSLG